MTSYDTDAPMSTMDWIFTHILLAIPFVNIACFVCWLFGMGNTNRVTYIRATVVLIVLAIVIAFGAGAVGLSLEQLGLD